MIQTLFQLDNTISKNEGLTKPISDQELHAIMGNFGPLKTPGPDGFPAIFFQKDWEMVKEDLLHQANPFLLHVVDISQINHTNHSHSQS